MAAVFPIRTDQPWVFNGVTYEYDATEDRWYVVSTIATDSVVEGISDNRSQIDVLDTIIDTEIENRSNLLNAAAKKNNQQDSAISGLDARVDALAASVGSLQFKGRYTYVLENSQAACDAALAAALTGGMNNSEALRAHGECVAGINDPYAPGTFTSKGATNVISDIEEFLITTEDLDGKTIDWLNVTEEGDYLEFFSAVDGDTALYEIVDEPGIVNSEQTIRVKFISETGEGDGLFNLQTESEIRVFKAAQGIDLDEANHRYVAKPYVVYFEDTPADITPVHPSGDLKNGELWFDTSSLELFVWNNNSWVASAKPPSQDIVVQNVVADVDELQNVTQETVVRINSLISDLMLEPNIYYSDAPPTGDITGTLRNGDLWIDSDDLEIKFYSGGAWINPDRQVGGDYLETTGGKMTGDLNLGTASKLNFLSAGDEVGTSIRRWDTVQTRFRVEKDKELNFTGYIQGGNEKRWMYWSGDATDSYGPGLRIHNLVEPSANKDAVNLGYLNTNYLPLTGGTITGSLIVKDGNFENLKVDADGKVWGRNGFVPTVDRQLANKSYVDTSLVPYLSEVDANATYLKISDYSPGIGGGGPTHLPLVGGTLTGTLTSNTGGGGNTSAFRITDQSDNKLSWFIWCPGGTGDKVKYVGRFGTKHWFQNYSDNDTDVRTTAKFEYGSYQLTATNSLQYSATDAHYFKGQVRFSSGAGELKLNQTPSNLDIYTTARFTSGIVVKKTGESITGDNSFAAFPDHTTYVGRQTENTDIVNKKYIDDRIAELEARIIALGG